MNIVCIGAHPDDCEVHAGGTLVKWARQGHRVLLVSLTNGDAGHYALSGPALAERRTAEAKRAAERGGVASRVLDHHDGELEATLENRKEVVRLIREWRADVVLGHRPNDYHPDHRYAAILVQDAAFMVCVPRFCPEAPRLERNPVFLHMMDFFRKPVPFQADVAVDVADALDAKLDMLDAMDSQYYEWLPWLAGTLDAVPAEPAARRRWLAGTLDAQFRRAAAEGRAALERWYGHDAAQHIHYAELFEISEYGRQPAGDEVRALFPFGDG